MRMELADRMNLITGDNGLGKSFLLDVAWWALTRRWPQDVNSNLTSGYAARPTEIKKEATIQFSVTGKTKAVTYTSTYSPRDQSWVGKSGRPLNPGLVIYAHADGGFSVWDPARNYWKKKGDADIQERLPGYVFSQKEVWEGLEIEIDGRKTKVCNGLIYDWASWIKEDKTPAKNMAIVLSRLSPSRETSEKLEPGPLTRIGINDGRDIPSLKTAYSDSVPILYASSGVRRIIALAYMLLWTWQEHRLAAVQIGEKYTTQVVFLIDELESHLHPRWQRSILTSLLELMTVLHSTAHTQLIAATHSPLILASAEPTFNQRKDAWFDLDLTNQTVEMRKRPYVRHGDISNWLTSEAFDLKEPRSLEAEQAIGRAKALLTQDPAAKLNEFDKVDTELRSVLGELDPFWVRWSANLERMRAAK